MNNKAFSLSLSLALGAVIMIYSYIQSREEEWAKRYGDEVPVVVAKVDVPELGSIKESMVDVKNIPKDYRAPGYTTEKKDVIGFIALVPIRAGEQITNNKIGAMGLRTGLSRQVAPGKRAVSLNVNETTGVSKLLKPGDRIDIIAVMDPPNTTGRGNQIAKTILQDVPVLAVGKFVTSHIPRREEKDESGKTTIRNMQENDQYSTITVEVDPVNAQTLVLLTVASGTTLSYSLRNNDDTERLVIGGTSAKDVLSAEAVAAPRTPAAVR